MPSLMPLGWTLDKNDRFFDNFFWRKFFQTYTIGRLTMANTINSLDAGYQNAKNPQCHVRLKVHNRLNRMMSPAYCVKAR